MQGDINTEYNKYPLPGPTPDNVPDGSEDKTGVPQNEAALEALQEAIRRVRDAPPSLTTVCFYAFQHTDQQLNAAEVSGDSRLLAAAFDSSAVKLWSLRARKLKAGPHRADVSKVRLACDLLEEEVSLKCVSVCV